MSRPNSAPRQPSSRSPHYQDGAVVSAETDSQPRSPNRVSVSSEGSAAAASDYQNHPPNGDAHGVDSGVGLGAEPQHERRGSASSVSAQPPPNTVPSKDLKYQDYLILLLRKDHPNGYLFDTKRDRTTGRVYIAAFRNDVNGNPGQLELSGCPLNAELLAVNSVATTGSYDRYLQAVNLLKGDSITLQLRIYGTNQPVETEKPGTPGASATAAAAKDESVKASPRVSAGPPTSDTARRDALASPSETQPPPPNHPPPADARRPSQQQRPADTTVPAIARPNEGASRQNSVIGTDTVGSPRSVIATTGNMVDAAKDLIKRLESGAALSPGDMAPVLPAVQKVLESAGFSHYAAQVLPSEYNNNFLPYVVGDYMGKFSPREQLESLVKHMKAQIDTVAINLCANAKQHSLHLSSSIKDARIFALQSALHKAVPLLATEGYRSLVNAPVFYLTEGHPMVPYIERFTWDLYLSKDSFRIIQLRRKPARLDADAAEQESSFFACYGIDTEALDKEIQRDKAAGRLPCAVLATFGAEAHLPYQCDNLTSLRQLCDRYSMWLHVEGSSVVLSVSPQSAPFIHAVWDVANSIVVEPLQWLQSRGTLAFTFLRSSKTHTIHQRHLIPPGIPFGVSDFSSLFTLWYHLVADHDSSPKTTPLQVDSAASPRTEPTARSEGGAETSRTNRRNGQSLLSLYITHNLELCRYFKTRLAAQTRMPVIIGPGYEHPHIVLFQLRPPEQFPLPLEEMNMDIDAFNKHLFARLHTLYYLQNRGMPLPKYAKDIGFGGSTLRGESQHDLPSATPDKVFAEAKEYMDSNGDVTNAPKTTSATFFKMPASAPSAPLPISQIIYDSKIGFLFHPLAQRSGLGCCSLLNEMGGMDGELGGGGPRGPPLRPSVTKAAIDTFITAVAQEVVFMERAAKARRVFQAELENCSELVYVPRSDFTEYVGVGAFRFVPSFPVPKAHLNALNVHLANLLSQKNAIYRGTVTRDDFVCTVVQFGPMIEEDVDLSVKSLVHDVLEVARKMELPPEVVQGLAQVVQEGIKAAEQKLQSATDDAYTPDKIIRKIPIFGSVFNWLSPPQTIAPPSQSFDIRSQALSAPTIVRPATFNPPPPTGPPPQ